MKLLSLNLWGGRQGQILLDYLKTESASTDIFCFQEVFDSKKQGPKEDQGYQIRLLQTLQSLLQDFNGYFSPAYRNWLNMKRTDFELVEGRAIFVRKNIELKNLESVYIFGNAQTEILDDFTNAPENVQLATLSIAGKDLLVANVHGKWYPGDKKDTQERIEQSEKILNAIKRYPVPKIICGDFNLLPDTKSIGFLERDYKNLIKDFGIKSTRNKVSWELNNNVQYFADYTFVSPEIKVKKFEVPYNEVSDHLPMVLEFEL